jgi:hypothetical protein
MLANSPMAAAMQNGSSALGGWPVSHELEELATLLISTGELTADDLQRLPSQAPARQGAG